MSSIVRSSEAVRQAVELLQHRPQRQHHVVAGVAVGDREHVEVVDLLAAGLERGQTGLYDCAEADDAGIGHRSAVSAVAPRRRPLASLGDLAGLQAARAHVHAAGRPASRRSGPAAGSDRSVAWWRPSSGCGCCRTTGPSRRRGRPWACGASIEADPERRHAPPAQSMGTEAPRVGKHCPMLAPGQSRAIAAARRENCRNVTSPFAYSPAAAWRSVWCADDHVLGRRWRSSSWPSDMPTTSAPCGASSAKAERRPASLAIPTWSRSTTSVEPDSGAAARSS